MLDGRLERGFGSPQLSSIEHRALMVVSAQANIFPRGLLYLEGRTSYGDCVEDEWFIVYMLREVTKLFPGAWARICDADGEFLLIEGANLVPSWLSPEVDANRVWINDGMLKIIPLGDTQATRTTSTGSSERSSLSLAEAAAVIKRCPDTLYHSQALDDDVFDRLRKYPNHLETSSHYTRLVIPRKIAYILHDRPRAIAPAVEAFVSRDPLTMKHTFDLARSGIPLHFPPSDLVVVSVRFTRVMYAQLRGQRFTPPNGWPALFSRHSEASCRPKGMSGSPQDDAALPENLSTMMEMSMKLTVGFEIMASTADSSNSRIVREVGLILEDLAEDGEGAYLPSDEEVQAWKDVDRESNGAWLNINFEDFERELNESSQTWHSPPLSYEGATDGGNRRDASPFGGVESQVDLRRIVSKFQSFLNDNTAGVEGADLGDMDHDDDAGDDNIHSNGELSGESSDEEDDGIAFNEEEFSRLMREMIGLQPSASSPGKKPSEEGIVDGAHKGGRSKTVPIHSLNGKDRHDTRDGEDGILELAAQFEAELKDHGALRLGPSKNKRGGKLTTKCSTAEGDLTPHVLKDDTESDEEGDVDVDVNLARNLLESFKSQEGMAGPAGNILNMLGLALPREEDDKTGVEGL